MPGAVVGTECTEENKIVKQNQKLLFWTLNSGGEDVFTKCLFLVRKEKAEAYKAK